MKLLRWKAVVPLGVILALFTGGWILLLDDLARRGVEEVGTFIVGARVDIASADVRLTEGAVTLRGLQVTNPDVPMTNLVVAQEIVADLRLLPLLERRVVVDTVAVRGVRFGTPRQRSGALDNPSAAHGRIRGEISQWASEISVPSFSLEGLSTVVNVSAIRPESLGTLVQARATVTLTDSLRNMWKRELAALNPKPQIDSLRAMVEQVRTANPLRLGITGVTRLVGYARSRLNGATVFRARLVALDSSTRVGLTDLRKSSEDILAAREADYADARRLLKLPSLEAPDISPALFAEPAIDRLKLVLYWMRLAEEYLPPGLNPRRYAGPKRSRRAGTTVSYRDAESSPHFLLEYGELDLELGGTGVEAGRYVARITGLTSEPALYGSPLRVLAERTGAARGPRDVRVAAVLNHIAVPVRDSLEVSLVGVTLPTLDLAPIGARLILGQGSIDLSLRRVGDQITGKWVWRSANVKWERLTGSRKREARSDAAGAAVGSGQWTADFLWRVVSSMRQVEIAVGIEGPVTGPSVTVSSNVGDLVATNLRRELGREIRRAQRQARSEVDRLVQEQVTAARARVAALELELASEIASPLNELDRLQAELREELQRLTRLRIPQ